jgi:hypothetical protein
MVSAAGLVAEQGSPLSHTAIIGRELGIPTVVGVEGATRRIESGQRIEIDGRTGTVRRSPPNESRTNREPDLETRRAPTRELEPDGDFTPRRGRLSKEEDLMRNRVRSLVPALILLALPALGPAPSMRADEPCSLGRAAGDWRYTITDVDHSAEPPASFGSFHLERDGSLKGTQTARVNGSVVEGEVLTGMITVGPDCTGRASVVFSHTPYPRTAALDIALENDSTEFHSTFTDDGLFFAVEAKQIDHD